MTARDDVVASSSDEEVRAALDRVVASPNFRASPRLASFLRFVVETTLDGHADRIKGYSIAVEALGRHDSFDPQTNPIVRVEAGRLRLALDRYYAGPGQHDRLVIDLPRGSYVPTFGRRRIVRKLRAFAVHGRRLVPRAVRKRLRLVAVVACIAAGVSITFNLASILAQRAFAPGICVQATSSELDKAGAPQPFEHYAGTNPRYPRADPAKAGPRT